MNIKNGLHNFLQFHKQWIPLTTSLIGGAAVGLPLFFYMKQCQLAAIDVRVSRVKFLLLSVLKR